MTVSFFLKLQPPLGRLHAHFIIFTLLLLLLTSCADRNEQQPVTLAKQLAAINTQTFYPASATGSANLPTWFESDWYSADARLNLDTPRVIQHVVDYLSILEQLLLTSDQYAAVIAELEQVQAQIPTDDPAAHVVWDRATFLLGYAHELADSSAEAITTYRTLIETAPNSLWARLAFGRLAPAP